jgi:hypothetical protein
VALSIGTVRFLFTDIEESARPSNHHPTQTRHTLARHDELIESIAVASRGRYWDRARKATAGSPCSPRHGTQLPRQCRFSAAAQASNTPTERWPPAPGAVAGRIALALRKERWPLAEFLPCIWDSDTGRAERAEVTPTAVMSTACVRRRSPAHGGQTLLSALRANLVTDCLPSDISLVTLDTYRLKGWPNMSR